MAKLKTAETKRKVTQRQRFENASPGRSKDRESHEVSGKGTTTSKTGTGITHNIRGQYAGSRCSKGKWEKRGRFVTPAALAEVIFLKAKSGDRSNAQLRKRPEIWTSIRGREKEVWSNNARSPKITPLAQRQTRPQAACSEEIELLPDQAANLSYLIRGVKEER